MNQIKARSRRISMAKLAELCNELGGLLDLEDAPSTIVAYPFQFLPDLSAALLYTIDPERKELVLERQQGLPRHAVAAALPLEGELIGRVVREKRSCIQVRRAITQECVGHVALVAHKLTSRICLPLLSMGNTIGVLDLYFSRARQPTATARLASEMFASQAALALQNVRWLHHIKFAPEKISPIILLMRSIASFNSDELLEQLLRTAQQIAHTPYLFLWFRDHPSGHWRIIQGPDLSPLFSPPDIEAGEGIIGHVLTTGQAYFSPDVRRDPYYFEIWPEITTELTLPLILDDQVIGILDIESPDPAAFGEEQYANLLLLTELALIFLRNSRIISIADMNNRENIILREIAHYLRNQQSLEKILHNIAEYSLTLVGPEKKAVVVMTLDREKGMLETKAATGELCTEKMDHFRIRLEDPGIVTSVIKSKQERYVPDVLAAPDYLSIIEATRSELCIPLVIRGQPIGVINIESSEPDAFSPRDIEMIRMLADYSAIATKIAELYDVRLCQLETLKESSRRISASLQVTEVLRSIVEEVHAEMGSPHRAVFVLTPDEAKERLEIAARAGQPAHKQGVGADYPGQIAWQALYENCHILGEDDPKWRPFAIRSEIAVPACYGARVLAIIVVGSTLEKDFGDVELNLLQGIAGQAGVALENAQLNQGLAETHLQLDRAQEVAVMGEIIAGSFHEIRTIISLISSDVLRLEDLHQKDQLDSPAVLRAVKNIKQCIERSDDLAENLRRLSRRVPPEFSNINIADLIQGTLFLLAAQIERNLIEVLFEYEAFDFSAVVDVGRVKRAFINILDNSIQAMPGGGRLSITGSLQEEHFIVTFSDTGVGMDEKELACIWKEFFTTKEKGMGLGLTVSKRIVEKDHHGRIHLASQKGIGTTVSVRLPRLQQL